jgi:hypothetical protein
MTNAFFKCVSRLLILTVFLLPFQPIQAAMVPTDQLLAKVEQSADRDKVLAFLDRADVMAQLQSLGVNAENAKQRVNALTDEEVQKIAGKIDELPAGGEWVAVLLILLVAWLVYVFIWKRR